MGQIKFSQGTEDLPEDYKWYKKISPLVNLKSFLQEFSDKLEREIKFGNDVFIAWTPMVCNPNENNLSFMIGIKE